MEEKDTEDVPEKRTSIKEEHDPMEFDEKKLQHIKDEHGIDRKVGIVEDDMDLDVLRKQLDLERRRLNEDRRQLELERERLTATAESLLGGSPADDNLLATKSDMVCVVCGERATGMHYMAITCEGCKIFFRRNSKKHATLKCTNLEKEGQCDVLHKRRFCSYCRFKKCRNAGMNMGRIWSEDRLKTRKPSKSSKPTPILKAKVKASKPRAHHHETDKKLAETATSPADDDNADVCSSTFGEVSTADAAASETSPVYKMNKQQGEELSGDHKQLIDSISQAFQRSMVLLPDVTVQKNITQIRKAHLQKRANANNYQFAQKVISLEQGKMATSSDLSTASPYMPMPAAKSPCSFISGAPPCGKDAAPLITMETKPAGKDVPSDSSMPHQSGPSGFQGPSSAGMFDFDDVMSKYLMEMVIVQLKQMIVFVKSLPVYNEIPDGEKAAFVKELFPDYFSIRGAQTYNPETKSFMNGFANPPEEFFPSDLCLGGFTDFVLKSGMDYCIQLGNMKFTEDESSLFCAMCILNPDRPSVSDVVKETIAPHYTRLVEVLCVNGRINHADQPLWFPQVMSLVTETRKCSESFKDQMMKLQLQGQSILPLLREILEI